MVKDYVYPKCKIVLGIAKNTSIKNQPMQEDTSGTIAQMPLNNGSSILCSVDSKDFSSIVSSLTMVSASGPESHSCPAHSTSSVHVSAKESTITIPMTTSISATDCV